MFAYIPARGGSKRVPRKNIKALGGKPVLGHTIEQLLKTGGVSGVYVSTEDDEIRRVAEEYGAQCLGPRAPELADDATGFIDLIHGDVPRYAEAAGDREVMFVLATAALVPARVYGAAVETFHRDRPNVLMSCTHYPVSPLWAMIQKPDGFWTPIMPQYCFTASKDLPQTLVDAGLFYLFDLDVMLRSSSLKVVDRLQAVTVEERYSVDVDWPEDWDMLERKFRDLSKGDPA